MKKKLKIYVLEEVEPYESSYIVGIYINKENALKAKKRKELARNELNYDLSYYVNEHEVKDLFNEKET